MAGPDFPTRVTVGNQIFIDPEGSILITDAAGRLMAIRMAVHEDGAMLGVGTGNVRGTINADRIDADRLLMVGSSQNPGRAFVEGANSKPAIQLISEPPRILLGRGRPPQYAGTSARIEVGNSASQRTVAIDGDSAQISFGVDGATSVGAWGVTLPGQSYTVRFRVADARTATAYGTVVVADPGGEPLRPCNTLADKRVVGVVAYGLGNAVLSRGLPGASAHVAVAGVVHCNVDARVIPVQSGDLLMTSETQGYAMKVLPHVPHEGAVLGKALAPLANQQGSIPILVALN